MPLTIPDSVLAEIRAHAEAAYPNEGAGLLLGRVADGQTSVEAILPLANAREAGAQQDRYLITPQDHLRGEEAAASQGREVIGVFHSHPDHPARPSEFDREHALPWYAYVITAVRQGRAAESTAWRLAEDRTHFTEEEIHTT